MKPGTDSTRWPELDVLRTLAIVLMILNHTAVWMQAPAASPWVKSLSFAGSMAPVVFFFLTGLGNGIQSIGKAPSRGILQFIKIGILIAADVFLWISPERFVGMDFLAFIGVSAWLLKELAHLPSSGRIAAGASLLLLAARYVGAPLLRSRLPDSGAGSLMSFMLGIQGLDGFSYPPAPWLAYPLLGYAFGRFLARRRDLLDSRRWGLVVAWMVAGVVLSAAATVMVSRGAPLFRWGTMSFAYFIASLAALAFLLAASAAVGSWRRADVFGTGAQASFAAVPIHFLLLAGFKAAPGSMRELIPYTIEALTVIVVALGGGLLVARLSGRLRRLGETTNVACWGIITVGAATAAVYLATNEPTPLVSATIRSSAQLGLCLLLGLPVPSPGRKTRIAA